MPYNTRRKSLSLPSLGIHLPNTSRSNRSPSIPKAHSTPDAQLPPSKKVKRSHDTSDQSSEEEGNSNVLKARNPSSALEQTPPPSPPDSATVTTKIDTEGINDDIVVAVIEQLEKTGNRPHLIKELATVLAKTNESIANSANAAALISSRLSLYLKRPWTALAPCPIAKELIPVHPRKVFFYLTNSPHQPLPQGSDDIIAPTVEGKPITPSASVASNDSDAADDELERERARLSPSPEVDLSNPEFDDEMMGDDLDGNAPGAPPSQPGSFPARSLQGHNHSLSHNHRSVSPPLEGDEKEFTQTASSVRERASAEDIAGRGKGNLGTVNDGEPSQLNHSTMDTEGDYVQSQTQDREYDYLTSHFIPSHGHGQQLATGGEGDFFATSHSPSASSDVSLSSATSVASDNELELSFDMNDEPRKDATSVLKGSTDVNVAAASIQIGSDGPKSVVRVFESKLQGAVYAGSGVLSPRDVDMTDAMPKGKPVTGVNVMGHVLDSWSDLQSPETVDIHELDAIFADI
ncbi:hypothetical protein VTO42DRAFT_4743 [Malbranchea cinnamomea]